jgi:hypothetical protein
METNDKVGDTTIFKYHEQVKEEYDEHTAICVACFAAVHLSTKIKMKDLKGGGYTLRVIKKFKKLGESLDLSQEQISLITDICFAENVWSCNSEVGGLNRSAHDVTIKEIIARKDGVPIRIGTPI